MAEDASLSGLMSIIINDASVSHSNTVEQMTSGTKSRKAEHHIGFITPHENQSTIKTLQQFAVESCSPVNSHENICKSNGSFVSSQSYENIAETTLSGSHRDITRTCYSQREVLFGGRNDYNEMAAAVTVTDGS